MSEQISRVLYQLRGHHLIRVEPEDPGLRSLAKQHGAGGPKAEPFVFELRGSGTVNDFQRSVRAPGIEANDFRHIRQSSQATRQTIRLIFDQDANRDGKLRESWHGF
jgi:hypothetical protein